MAVHPTCHIAGLHREHDRVHEIPRRLNQRRGGVQAGDDELPGDGVHVGLHLAGDAELVGVEGDALQVGEKVALGGGLRTVVGDAAAEGVQPFPGFADGLRSLDHILKLKHFWWLDAHCF